MARATCSSTRGSTLANVPTAPEMDAWQIAARRPYARYKAQTEPRLVSKIEEIVAKTRKA